MRLYEIANPQDARSVLDVIRGLANKNKIPSEIPFAAFKNYIQGDELGIGTPDALIAFKNSVDPTGDVIQDVLDNGTVILNTKVKSTTQNQTPVPTQTPSIDKMASSAAKQSISSKI